MNCHGDINEKKGKQKHSPLKHVFHMIICCGLPMVVIVFLPFIMKYNPIVGNVFARVAPFLCPLMMILMVLRMLGSNKRRSCCDRMNDSSCNEALSK